jgi:hypothetical protein
MGMGGAFVAVADDSTATWWNPAGLATGAFSDMSLARADTDLAANVPARRDRVSWFAVTSPAVGFSYYRLRITDIQRSGPTGEPLVDRQDTRNGLSVRSFSANELGLTIVQSIFSGIHAGATLKYVRGTLRTGADDASRPPADVLDSGEALSGGNAEGRFDLDVGVIGVAGPVRLGAVMRNVRAPKFGGGEFILPRQTRVGAALTIAKTLTLAVDADARRYATASGDRRVIAAGAEEWLAARRIGIRGGARFNRVGGKERAATAGVSLAMRKGTYLEGQVTRGGADAERGWGFGARVTF